MAGFIKGKQIANATIVQSNLNIPTASITTASSVTNKEYVDNYASSAVTSINFSNTNVNMTASATTASSGYQKACATALIATPKSLIKVLINGVEVNVGAGLDCVFSPDGSTLRVIGTEQVGDYLYWNTNGAPYQLDANDEIDFIYLVNGL
jgi:hypothetical protein